MGDDELWQAVHTGTLPAPSWTHEAHVRMAWMYLQKHAIDDAHILLRVAIIRLNAAHGLVETPVRGYHDTMTRAWLLLVAAESGSCLAAKDSRAFWSVVRLPTDAPLAHYSRERLFSSAARAHFVAPDLAPFPEHEAR